MMKSTLRSILIEQHDVPPDCKDDIKELVSASVKSVECTVNASRAFFSDLTSVRDHIHKIGFYEREADKIAIRLKKAFFYAEGPLDRKMHLRDLVTSIEEIADEAENVGDRLTIFCIKRAP
jgi:predicted phosphate transport protein (TIGR00153 family)